MPNLKEIEKGLNSNLGCECLAAAKACKNMRISEGKILNWIDAKRWPWRLAAIYACFNKQEVNLSVVEKGILDRDYDVQDLAAELCCTLAISSDVILEWSGSKDWRLRRAAMCACTREEYVKTTSVIDKGLQDGNSEVAIAAAKACEGAKVSFEKITRWARSRLWSERLAAIYACEGRNDIYPLEIVEKRLTDGDKLVSSTAIKACKGISMPRRKIIGWANSEIWQKRAAAMMATIGRIDIPEKIVTDGLKDKCEKVRDYAREADQTEI